MCDTLKKCHKKYLTASNPVTFLNRLPYSGTYQKLVEQLNDLTLDDLGIEGNNDPYYFRPEEGHDENKRFGITVSHIVDNEDYSVILLFMKKGEKIPLHDHEEMSVLTRVLTGKVKYRALDKVEPELYSKDPLSVFMYY
eukprot:CAMPEP_0168329478 /NCGR_PEP_ID=MMETSP0213-20121227/7135_1 /TAXON_ID=151035 /ORGANISM="Euplotes harpa, Strain FSP1.4" /LENGTH=138 /DNA_ID=CAMNT_0008332817 /DNA_START=67 /DNA_END=483 /DNA_ORIENTATION=+